MGRHFMESKWIWKRKKKDQVTVLGKLDLKSEIYTILIVLGVSYVLCIIAAWIFGWKMYQAWKPLLPGFVWPVTIDGFFNWSGLDNCL